MPSTRCILRLRKKVNTPTISSGLAAPRRATTRVAPTMLRSGFSGSSIGRPARRGPLAGSGQAQLLLLSLVDLFLKVGNNFAKHFFTGIFVDFPVEQDIHMLVVFPDQSMKFRNNFIKFIHEFTSIAHTVPPFVSPVHSVITDFPRMLSDL